MSNQAQRRLGYLLKSYEFSQISAFSGIPSATLSAVYEGEYRLPMEYNKPLRNLYQRTTYANLRKSGYSPTQARRYQWYGVSGVETAVESAGDIISKYTNAVIDKRIEGMKRNGSYTTYQEAYQRVYEGIRDKISRSTLPPERLNELIESGSTNIPNSKSRTRRKGTKPHDNETV